MSYALRIQHLEKLHEHLNNEVDEMQRRPVVYSVRLQELKRKKLQVKDEIYRLQRLEQEEDRDYVRAEADDY